MHQRGSFLTPDSQFVHLCQWIGEFSEIEKDDFLQHLLDLYAPGQLAIGYRVAKLKDQEKLPSLFDCRVELLNQWFSTWESADRDEFLSRLKEADGEFLVRFEKSKNTPNDEKNAIEEFWLKIAEEAKVENGGDDEQSDDHSKSNGDAAHNNLSNGHSAHNGAASPAKVDVGESEKEEKGEAEQGAPSSSFAQDEEERSTAETVTRKEGEGEEKLIESLNEVSLEGQKDEESQKSAAILVDL